MKNLKRFLILQLMLFMVIPAVLGEMTITLSGKDLYNLGDKLSPTVSIKEDSAYDGYISLMILCDNYDFLYHKAFLRVAAGVREQLTIPDLILSKSMVTKCSLKSNFEADNGEKIDSASSEYFFVSDKLNIIVDGNFEAKPGEDVVVFGEIRKSNNEIMSKGEAKISFKGKEEKVDVVAGEFEHTIHLENDAEAGNIPLLVAVTDKYGNYGDQLLDLRVLSIPTRIENSFDNSILMPGDTFKAKVSLYDHSGKVINGSRVNIKIFDPDEELIAEKDIQNSNYFEFKTEKAQMPGNYFLLGAFEDIKEQSTFKIETVRKIVMSQDGSFVYIENVGNIDYDDEVTVILESDDKKYLINKKVELKAGEKITIDLSKEVPQGTYDVILPKELVETDAPAVDSNNESEGAQEVVEQTNVAENVEIEDNRNVIKKTADGMSAVTGAVVGAAGYVASRPTIAAIILVLIILGTVTRYSWSFVKNKVKGKKEGDTSHIFEDFKYDENNKPGN